MHPDKFVVQCGCCHGKRQTRAVTHAFALGQKPGVSIEGSSNGFLHFHSNPQSGLANGPMSGPHSCTDGIAVATPMPMAFHSDQGNEQHKPTAVSPRYGRSIDRMWRSACSSPPGMAEDSQVGSLGVALWSNQTPAFMMTVFPQKDPA